MGMDQSVQFEEGKMPAWETVRELLNQRSFALQIRMIDGELAFPDEQPSLEWREIRVGTPDGMVTLRRDGNRIGFVIWGNADLALREAWNALTWAFATLGSGQIIGPEGPRTASEFTKVADLPQCLRNTEA